jgi:hypothetical protein
MRIAHIALLSAMVFGAVSCAQGTGDVADLANGGASTLAASGGSSTGGSSADGASTGGSSTRGSTTDGSPAGIAGSPPLGVSSEVMGDYSLDVSCAGIPVVHVCLLSMQADKDVTFTLTPGTQRSSIVYTVTTKGPDAGGSVDFAGTNPLDGTVRLHGYAGAFSSVHIEVTGVIVVPE